MPNIKVLFWNIENFGDANTRRGQYVRLGNFIGQVLLNTDADVLLMQEVREPAANALRRLHLIMLGAVPGTDWYFDWIPGSLDGGAAAPYNTNAHLDFTTQGRREGYAVFWKQNIAKFTMQRADPIDPATVGAPVGAMLPNTQSFGVRARQAGGAVAANALVANVTVPAGAGAFQLPFGSVVAAPGVLRLGAVVAGPGPIAAATPLNSGDIIPAGTMIGPGGLLSAAVALGANPIVVPQGFMLTNTLTLPPAGAVLVPRHTLSLVLTGRQPNMFGVMQNFNPAGANAWGMLHFPDGIGAVYGHPRLTRRPATCTIRINTGVAAGAAAELIPITTYHTPLRAPAMVGMAQASYARSLYQAYDHTAGAYINCNRAIIGGDFNKRLNPGAGNFTIYTDTFANGGAGCNHAGAQNIRVNTPFPFGGLPAPVFPPLPAVPGPANNPVNKSLITVRQNFHGQRLLSLNPDHYRSSAFDNVFYRGFSPPQAPNHAIGDLYFLVNAVRGVVPAPANFYIPAAIIADFQHLRVFNPPGAAAPIAPAAGIGNVLNAGTLLADIQAGGFGSAYVPGGMAIGAGVVVPGGAVNPTGVAAPAAGAGPFAGPAPVPAVVIPQRRAVEFIKTFISDHLPVIFEMNL